MIDTANLNKLKIALNQIENGEEPRAAVAKAEYVNYDQRLIDKINILKNIPILNEEIVKFLFGINLTDKIEDVAPKVNAIYQLALNAKLIEDRALEQEEAKHKQDEVKKIAGSTTQETAQNVLQLLLNLNK